MAKSLGLAILLLAVTLPAAAQALDEAAWRFHDTVWLGRFWQDSRSFTMVLAIERCDGRTFAGTSRWVDLGDSLLELEGAIEPATGELVWRYTRTVRGGGIVLDGRFRARLSADRRGFDGDWTSSDGGSKFTFSCRDARFRPRMLGHLFPPGPPDPGAAGRIDDLIAALGETDWDRRERATSALADLGDLARESLARAAAGDPDPEVRARCREMLKRLGSIPDVATAADELHDFAAHAARTRLDGDPRYLAELLAGTEVQIGARAARRLLRRIGESLPGHGASIGRFSPR